MGFILEAIFLVILALVTFGISAVLHFLFGIAGLWLFVAAFGLAICAYAGLLWWDTRN